MQPKRQKSIQVTNHSSVPIHAAGKLSVGTFFWPFSAAASICRLHSLLLRARWNIPNRTKVEWTQVVLVYITMHSGQTNHVVDTPPTRQMLLVSCRKLPRTRKKSAIGEISPKESTTLFKSKTKDATKYGPRVVLELSVKIGQRCLCGGHLHWLMRC